MRPGVKGVKTAKRSYGLTTKGTVVGGRDIGAAKKVGGGGKACGRKWGRRPNLYTHKRNNRSGQKKNVEEQTGGVRKKKKTDGG